MRFGLQVYSFTWPGGQLADSLSRL
jgi:hypothetical protein